MPAFLLRRANNRMLLNDASAADDARRVASNKEMSTFHEAAQHQLAAISERRPDEGAIYAELIPANRLAVDHRWNEAQAAYERAAAAHPGDWQVRYRLAYLEFQRGNYDAAARGLEPIASTGAKIPRWLRAAALLNLGWTNDIGGRRADALRLYKKVVDEFEDQSAATGARLGLLSPYRPRSPTSTSARVMTR